MSANIMKLPISLFKAVDNKLEASFKASAELRACAVRINEHGRRTVEACIAIGAELVKAREITRGAWQGGTQEGEWRRFLDETLQMPLTQAMRFIYVYERYGVPTSGHPLPVAPFSVLAELAAPEADPEVVAKLEEKITKGERVTVGEVVKAKRKKKRAQKKKPGETKREPSALERLQAAWDAADEKTRMKFLKANLLFVRLKKAIRS